MARIGCSSPDHHLAALINKQRLDHLYGKWRNFSEGTPPPRKQQLYLMDDEPHSSALGLTPLGSPQTPLPLEVRKQLAAGAGCYICMDQHLEGTQGTTHQKTSQLFCDCERKARFRNHRSHPYFNNQHRLLVFLLGVDPFLPHPPLCVSGPPTPLYPHQAAQLKLCLDSPGSLKSTENAKLCLILKHGKMAQKLWTILPDISGQLSVKQKEAVPVQLDLCQVSDLEPHNK